MTCVCLAGSANAEILHLDPEPQSVQQRGISDVPARATDYSTLRHLKYSVALPYALERMSPSRQLALSATVALTFYYLYERSE